MLAAPGPVRGMHSAEQSAKQHLPHHGPRVALHRERDPGGSLEKALSQSEVGPLRQIVWIGRR